MKTEWDYTDLANAYLSRPAYAASAIDKLFAHCCLSNQARACDIGAGVGHLTIELAKRGLQVTAVEPNDAMRSNGIKQTKHLSNVTWLEGSAEDTKQRTQFFDIVTFGSSFNVCQRDKALVETARILKPRGYFACMWNHRDLSDQIQSVIESIIKQSIKNYQYGSRREDQEEVINACGLFEKIDKLEGTVIHHQQKADCVEAWRSHATLARQAGDKFKEIVRQIEEYLFSFAGDSIEVPYTTRIWVARLK